MTIPHLPININLNPTPTIYEQQTSARQDLQNQANMGKGNVVIVPQSDTDLIPFSKLAERNTWNYRSEADRPSLPPVFTARGSGATIEEKTGSAAEENYNILHDQLPEGLKADMAEYPTPLTASLTALLKSLAEGVTWQESVKVMLNSENAMNRQEANLKFPDQTFANTIAIGNELVTSAYQLLADIGPSDPHYLDVKAFVDDVNTYISQVKE
jgi:hypothetical protein